MKNIKTNYQDMAEDELQDLNIDWDSSDVDLLSTDELLAYRNRLIQKRINAIANDFKAFWNYCWPETPIAPHHIEWHKMLAPGPNIPCQGLEGGSDRVLIIAPRSWGKTIFMIRRVLWELGHNPIQFISIVSADDGLAANILSEISRNIVTNERLHILFPRLKPGDIWQRTQIVVERSLISKDPTVRASGLFSTGVGGRAHLIIFDDVVAWRTAQAHPSLRDESKQIFHMVWMNYLLPGGRAMSLCTPWHPFDLNMELKMSGKWAVWERAALIDKQGNPDINGESSWPEVWSKEELLAKRQQDEGAFEMQYMLNPRATTHADFQITDILDNIASRPPSTIKNWPKYIGVDVGLRAEGHGSYSSIFVLAVNPQNGSYWTLDVFRTKCTATELLELIVDVGQSYKPELVYVENNAFQQALIEFLDERRLGFSVQGFTTTTRKNDSTIGIPALASRFRNGQWVTIHDHPEEIGTCECAKCHWVRELSEWPGCKFGDTVMAMWLATRAAAADYPSYGLEGGAMMPIAFGNEDLDLMDYEDEESEEDLEEQPPVINVNSRTPHRNRALQRVLQSMDAPHVISDIDLYSATEK